MTNANIIPSVAQIRECEKFTMEHCSISSAELMERAGTALAKRIQEIVTQRHIPQVHIFCGCGNNGGDGMVIARILRQVFSPCELAVHVYLCQNDSPRHTDELILNKDRWNVMLASDYPDTNTSSFRTYNPDETPEISENDLIIDALFGIGLSKTINGIFAEAILTINSSEAFTIAIDIPSGLFADTHTPPSDAIILADLTLSVQFPKLVFMLPEAHPIYGEVEIIDIGMLPPPSFDCKMEYTTPQSIASILHRVHPFGHKGTFGHGLLIAGCVHMPGAAILSATAALRGGIGKLTVHTPSKVAQHFPAVLPEAILNPDLNEDVFSEINWSTLQNGINAIAVGPGLSTHPKAIVALKNLLDEIKAPIILDADALNILSDNKTWFAFLPPYSILTPHFKEFERMAGPADNDFHRVELARSFSMRNDVVLILKGHHTLISLPDGRQYFNTSGNVCLATAGSGDVLTGLLLSLLAQGYNPVETAILGVFIHGAAGDLYQIDHYDRGMLASDIPNLFGAVLKAFKSIR